MKTFRLTFVLLLFASTLLNAQSIINTNRAEGDLKTPIIHAQSQPSKPVVIPPVTTVDAKIVLSHFDPTTPTLNWPYPAIYGPFLALFFAQRFTCPGTGGFIDTIEINLESIGSGQVKLTVYDAQKLTASDGRKFWYPNLNVPLGDTLIDGSNLGSGFTKIPTYHTLGGKWQIPKEFFVTLESYPLGSVDVTLVSDTKVRTQKDIDSSRTVMITQSGMLLMDSVFRQTSNGPYLYPNFHIRAYLTTSDPQSPVITSTPVTNAQVNQSYSYAVSATGNPLPTFSLIKNPGGMNIIPSSGLIVWNPQRDQIGTHTVIVRATNNKGHYDQSFDITVVPGPGAPKITSSPPLTATENVLYTYQVQATGTPKPTFVLQKKPTGMTINSSTGLISWTPTPSQMGNDSVTVRAQNSDGITDQSFVIVVSGQIIPPTFTNSAPTEATAEQLFNYDAEASGKPAPTFRLVQGPVGMTIDTVKGILSWTPVRQQKGGNDVILRVVNMAGQKDQQFTLNVSTLPLITSTPIKNAKVGEQYIYNVVADAFPAAHFKFVISPSGMTIDTLTGAVRWMPIKNDVGTHVMAITAYNKAGGDTHLDSITVTNPVSVEPEHQPTMYTLNQNYPNPFSTSTSITFTLSHSSSNVSLKIFDALGREVQTIINGVLSQGEKTAHFTPLTLNGGTYFYQLRIGSNVQTRVMHYIR